MALAAVLREAITNVLRHSTAHRVVIESSAADGVVRLQVTNDGIVARSPERAAGMGIGSMTTRVEALDGRLTAITDSAGRFHLVAEIPCPDGMAARATVSP